MYAHLPPIYKTLKVRRIIHGGPSWRCEDKLIWRYPMNHYTWTCQCWSTSKSLPRTQDPVQKTCREWWIIRTETETERERERTTEICASCETWFDEFHIYIYIYDYHHVVPQARVSLTLCHHFSLSFTPPAGLQGYIPYPHIVAVSMFKMVVLLLLGHMWGSIGVHHLWARPCFSSSVLHVWFV